MCQGETDPGNRIHVKFGEFSSKRWRGVGALATTARRPLSKQEAAPLVPLQLWWKWKLKDTNIELSDLCVAIAKTRAIATLT